jgi:hypothetical protein
MWNREYKYGRGATPTLTPLLDNRAPYTWRDGIISPSDVIELDILTAILNNLGDEFSALHVPYPICKS